jgi:cysteine desulfurase/selenocysteine lyase
MQISNKNLNPGSDIRAAFPLFGRKKSHYLDSAASTQKPAAVIERISNYLSYEHANIHRGAYSLSADATDNYDEAKIKIAKYIGAENEKSLIYTRGTTEGVNLIANAYEDNFEEGDFILLTLLEHHSNIVPWQLLAKRKKLNLIYADITEHAELDVNDFLRKLKDHKPKLVSFTHVANSFGTVFPIEELTDEAKKVGAKVFIDAAQSVQHKKLNVSKLEVDFLAFSGHKIYGPTGIGILYVKPGNEEFLKPYQSGGDMISNVTIGGSEWAAFPQKFEAGTPAIAEAIALGTAIDFISEVGLEKIIAHENKLFAEAFELLSKQTDLTLYGPAVKHGASSGNQASIISFNLKGVHAHDLSTVADTFNVQIRAGHHCAIPALNRLKIPSSARASIGMYSCIEDFEILVEAAKKAKTMFT